MKNKIMVLGTVLLLLLSEILPAYSGSGAGTSQFPYLVFSASLTINLSYIVTISGDMVLDDGSSFTNNGILQFSGADCQLSDNRTTKSTIGDISIRE